MVIKQGIAMQNNYKKQNFLHLKLEIALDITATNISKFTSINRMSINQYFDRFRKIIFLSTTNITPETGIFELAESYFGAKRIKGKRGRGALGKTPVFGIKKRDGLYMQRLLITVAKNS